MIHPKGVEVTWLHRGEAAPGTSDVLERAVRAADRWPGSVYAWFAGESQVLRPIRTFLSRLLAAADVVALDPAAPHWRAAHRFHSGSSVN